MEYCTFCGKPTNTKHHLIFGWSQRRLADEDKLYIYCCDNCHNMAVKPVDRIHGNSQAEKLSKMLGQALYERNLLERGEENVRQKFMQRYGRSYL